mmetsp:Transcript_5940/g.14309  ORF Transcript_5940/g.14309 Transcript_5940/m.14309 type:complete len:412 (-) Transcript_5940:77-1312(-)
MAAAVMMASVGHGLPAAPPSSPSRFVNSVDSKPIVIVVEDTNEWKDSANQAKLFLTSLVLPLLPPIVQQRINRSMLVQRSSGASPPASMSAGASEGDDLPIGILPVPPGSEGANSLAVHGNVRCTLENLGEAYQSQQLMSWIEERPLVASSDSSNGSGVGGGSTSTQGGTPAHHSNGPDLHVVAQPDIHEIGDAAAFRANAAMVEVVINHRSADGLILRNVTMEVLNNLTGLQVCAAIVCRPGPTGTKIYVFLNTKITPMHPIPTPPTMIPSPSNHQSLVQFKSKVISALALEGGFQHFLMTLDGQAFGSRVPLFAHTSFAAGCVIDIGTTHTTCDARAALCTRRMYAHRRPHAPHAPFSLRARLDHTSQRTLGTAQRHRATRKLPAIHTPRPVGRVQSASHDPVQSPNQK